MGAGLKPNPYGNCSLCNWTDGSPNFLFCLISGVQPPNLHDDWILYNGLYLLKATDTCEWGYFSDNVEMAYSLQIGSSLLMMSADPTGSGYPYNVFFQGFGNVCESNFTNVQDSVVADYFYHVGTAEVFLQLDRQITDWVIEYGFLPEDSWKYEQDHSDNKEQVFLGSRKYKCNCRIKFDPDQM